MTKQYETSSLSIKAWAEEDRPREKMILKGKSALSDSELIAILIGSGTREESAVEVAKKILDQVNGDLNALGKKTLKELTTVKGIGEAKAVSVMAALELGRRRQQTPVKTRPQIRSSRDAYAVLAPLLEDLPHEEFWILLLNRANRVVAKEQISLGGVAGTVVDAKLIFKKALEHLASGIILCHNHPSGNLQPSKADCDITAKLKTAGKALEINVLDHLIISEQGYFSFADEGRM